MLPSGTPIPMRSRPPSVPVQPRLDHPLPHRFPSHRLFQFLVRQNRPKILVALSNSIQNSLLNILTNPPIRWPPSSPVNQSLDPLQPHSLHQPAHLSNA